MHRECECSPTWTIFAVDIFLFAPYELIGIQSSSILAERRYSEWSACYRSAFLRFLNSIARYQPDFHLVPRHQVELLGFGWQLQKQTIFYLCGVL